MRQPLTDKKVPRNMGDILSVVEHLAAARLQQSGYCVQRCGFSGSVCTDQRNDLSLLNGK